MKIKKKIKKKKNWEAKQRNFIEKIHIIELDMAFKLH